MQYSTNSNWNTEQIIRSRPTPAGRFRQAMLQMQDRVWNAQDIERGMRIRSHRIAMLRVDLEQMQSDLDNMPEDCFEFRRSTHQAAILKEELAGQEELNRRDAQRLRDNHREAEVCQKEIESIKQMTGIDFAEISEEEFQKHMTQESKMYLARNLAASEMSAITGLPMMATEAWMSYTEDFDSLCALKESFLREAKKAFPKPPEGFGAPPPPAFPEHTEFALQPAAVD